MQAIKNNALHTLTLFASFGTLICCALPALLVTIGAGATLAGLVTNVPQLVWISAHKTTVFIFAGAMLGFSGVAQYRARYAPCPIDPAQAAACARLRKMGRVVFVFSLAMYATGFFFAFIAPQLMR